MAELFYRKLTGLPGDESPVVMVTTGGSGGGVVGLRLVVWGWEAPPPGTFSTHLQYMIVIYFSF